MIDRIRQIEWDNRAVMHEARTEGKREGLEEGLELGRISSAMNMLADGLDIKTIAKYVNLPESKSFY